MKQFYFRLIVYTMFALSTQHLYAQNSSPFQENCEPGSLTTGFDSDNVYGGNMFDVRAIESPVHIDRFDLNLTNHVGSVSVYYKEGSYQGFETNTNAWTLLGTAQVEGAGANFPTPVYIGGLTIPVGETYGLYITTDGNSPLRMNYKNDNSLFENEHLEIQGGVGLGSPFYYFFYENRSWTGVIHYCAGETYDYEPCTEPQITEVSDQSICSGENAVLNAVSDGQEILWFETETGNDLVGTGNEFETPLLYQTTSFWVEARNYDFENYCASPRIEVIVEVNQTPVPEAETTQLYAEGQTLSDLIVNGENLQWYGTYYGSNPLPETLPTTNGTTYYVSQTVDGCESDLIGILVTNQLSIAEQLSYQFEIYPNPVSEILYIKSNQLIDRINIHDFNGNMISTKIINNHNPEINVSELASGIYFIQIISGDSSTVKKIIVK